MGLIFKGFFCVLVISECCGHDNVELIEMHCWNSPYNSSSNVEDYADFSKVLNIQYEDMAISWQREA